MHAFKEADMSYLEDLSGGDQSLIIEMLRLFLSQTPGYLDSLSRHIDLGDWSNTQSMAHHIKPTLAYMGAEDMRQALIRIEQMAKADPVDSVVLKREFSVLRGRFEVLFKELEGHLGFLTSKM